jgi:hypothetical protein
MILYFKTDVASTVDIECHDSIILGMLVTVHSHLMLNQCQM